MTFRIQRLTPILSVAAIEPSLAFLVDRAGFQKTVEVPGPDGRLGFCILVRDGVELMLQTHASIRDDLPALYEAASASFQFLYVEVDSIDAVEAAMSGIEPLVPRRTTFYGATETAYREPGGHVVVFSQTGAEPDGS
ncbi:MAG: hypothetical protein H6836_09475 [Planctomycetes bacterium]|nr:hypothetical protein [Planctomycetota bacterium]